MSSKARCQSSPSKSDRLAEMFGITAEQAEQIALAGGTPDSVEDIVSEELHTRQAMEGLRRNIASSKESIKDFVQSIRKL